MIGFRNDVVQPEDTVAFFLYHFDGTTWSLSDSVVRTSGLLSDDRFGRTLFAVDGRIFSAGYGVFEKNGTSWNRLFYSDKSLVRLAGTSASNLFAVGSESQVYHYDGINWYRYPQFQSVDKVFTSAWAMSGEVFVVGNDGQRTYILHGK
ncbi:MAG: hypothetical protein ABSE41_17620 [Bacteroidota bacterium]|jgi:hypothetical protein